MFAYIKGHLTSKNPDHVVIESGGIGYEVNISLHTFEQIKSQQECMLYTYFYVREDIQALYGFYDTKEKALFKLLLGVSGVGASTARMILSYITPGELVQALQSEDELLIRKIKGVGPKSAKRLILELKDKVINVYGKDEISTSWNNKIHNEALSALMALGFSKTATEKVVSEILRNSQSEPSIEEVIKAALKKM